VALVTVVRSLVGNELPLPDGRTIRPWCYVEIRGPLDDAMKACVRRLKDEQQVQIGQVVDGAPISNPNLDRRG